MDYFDFIFDVQDFLSNKSRVVRVASKRYPQATYLYLKLFIQHQKRWKMQQTIDISWMELSNLLSVVKEIQSYPNGIPKEGNLITGLAYFVQSQHRLTQKSAAAASVAIAINKFFECFITSLTLTEFGCLLAWLISTTSSRLYWMWSF